MFKPLIALAIAAVLVLSLNAGVNYVEQVGYDKAVAEYQVKSDELQKAHNAKYKVMVADFIDKRNAAKRKASAYHADQLDRQVKLIQAKFDKQTELASIINDNSSNSNGVRADKQSACDGAINKRDFGLLQRSTALISPGDRLRTFDGTSGGST